MSDVVASPQEIRRFARNLGRFNKQLHGSRSQLHAHFQQLGETWLDQEQRKFARQFEETMRVLDRFRTASEQQIPFLLRKAQRLEEYLNQQ